MTKFKVFLFMIFFTLNTQAGLNSNSMGDCLDTDFKVEVTHKTFPFGLLERVIYIEKNKCVLKFEHESYRFMKKGWEVDACREPVHIKEGVHSIDILKFEANCHKKSKSDFCKSWLSLETLVQDDGLIFASGEKEDINSDHGKVYCAYIMAKRYLRDGEILSRYDEPSAYYPPKASEVIEESEVDETIETTVEEPAIEPEQKLELEQEQELKKIDVKGLGTGI